MLIIINFVIGEIWDGMGWDMAPGTPLPRGMGSQWQARPSIASSYVIEQSASYLGYALACASHIRLSLVWYGIFHTISSQSRGIAPPFHTNTIQWDQ